MNVVRTLSRDEIRELCRSLGFDPAMVVNISVFPEHVEVTVYVPIVDDPRTPLEREADLQAEGNDHDAEPYR